MDTSAEILGEGVKWSLPKKFLFFFIFFYSFLYIFPSPIDEILNGEDETSSGLKVFNYYYKIPDALTYYTGSHILHIDNLKKIEQTGSGDTTFDYVRVLTFFLLALVLAAIASIIGRRKANYTK